MKEFNGKIAVITGAASGIGRAIADRCVAEGMKVVLADIDEASLSKAETELKIPGGAVLGVRTDVSKRNDVELLARRALEAFGEVHLLFNNAGIAAGGAPGRQRGTIGSGLSHSRPPWRRLRLLAKWLMWCSRQLRRSNSTFFPIQNGQK